MSAAAAITIGDTTARPARPVLSLVPPPPASAWRGRNQYRQPDPDRRAVFGPLVHDLAAFAAFHHLRLAWITFTSSAEGSKPIVAEDIKRCWDRFRHKAVWRKVVGFLAVFATHGRPHVHVLAVLPAGVSARAITNAWSGGFTGYAYVPEPDDADDVADYCAAQFATTTSNSSIRLRSFSARRPTGARLVCSASAAAGGSPAVLPPRACAGGDTSFTEAAGEGERRAPSCRPAGSERPQAVGDTRRPESDAEANHGSPHRRSERVLRLLPPPPMEMNTMNNTINSTMPTPASMPAAAACPSPYSTPSDVEIAVIAARSFVPRTRDTATCIMGMAGHANIDWKLVEVAMKELYFLGQVKRRKDGRGFVYWASKSLPPPIPVVIPERMRAFMLPTFRSM